MAAGDDHDGHAGIEQRIDDRLRPALDGHALDVPGPDQLPQARVGVRHLEAVVTPPAPSTTHTACRSFAQSMPAYRRIPSMRASALLPQPGGTLA